MGTPKPASPTPLKWRMMYMPVRANFDGITTPVWLRLFRHRDTSHLLYMTADGKQYTDPDAEADKAFNGPMDPPTSGADGQYFWIRQNAAGKNLPAGVRVHAHGRG